MNTIAPSKTVRVKNNAKEWCDRQIAEKINKRDYSTKLNKKMHLDKVIYKEAHNAVQNLIWNKKTA